MRIDNDLKATGAILLTIIVGFGFGIYLPNRIEQGQLEERIAQREQQAIANEKTAKGLRDLRAAVHDMRLTLETSSKVIPESNDLASFLRVVDTELDRGRMIQPEKLTDRIVEGQDYNVIPLSLRFQGDYDRIFEFVKKLEAGDRLIRINRLELKGKPDESETPVEVRVELTTFSAPSREG